VEAFAISIGLLIGRPWGMGRQSPEPPIAFDLRQEPGAGPITAAIVHWNTVYLHRVRLINSNAALAIPRVPGSGGLAYDFVHIVW
jgi:hypothetical protein